MTGRANQRAARDAAGASRDAGKCPPPCGKTRFYTRAQARKSITKGSARRVHRCRHSEVEFWHATAQDAKVTAASRAAEATGKAGAREKAYQLRVKARETREGQDAGERDV